MTATRFASLLLALLLAALLLLQAPQPGHAAKIADIAYFKPAKLPEGVPAGLEASGRYHARSPMIWAARMAVSRSSVSSATAVSNHS